MLASQQRAGGAPDQAGDLGIERGARARGAASNIVAAEECGVDGVGVLHPHQHTTQRPPLSDAPPFATLCPARAHPKSLSLKGSRREQRDRAPVVSNGTGLPL